MTDRTDQPTTDMRPFLFYPVILVFSLFLSILIEEKNLNPNRYLCVIKDTNALRLFMGLKERQRCCEVLREKRVKKGLS